MNEERTIFDMIRDILEEMECDDGIRGSREWDLVKDRYDDNLEELKDLVEQL